MNSLLPALMRLFSLSHPPLCPSAVAMSAPCLSPPSAHRALTYSVPSGWDSACHGETQDRLEAAQGRERGGGHPGSCCQQRRGTQGEETRASLHWGKGRLHGKRGRKQISQGRSCFSFLPIYPHVNGWAGDYPWGPSSPLAYPPAADTRRKRKWKSKRNRQI